MKNDARGMTGAELDRLRDAEASRDDAEYVLQDIFVELDRIADSPEGLSEEEVRGVRHIQKDVRQVLDRVEEGSIP